MIILKNMEDDEKHEIIEEAMHRYEEKDRGCGSGAGKGWSEFAFKVVFPMASAVVASVARALCEHFLGG